MSLTIKVETIDADAQRYPTCGDWAWAAPASSEMPPLGTHFVDANNLQVRVTDMGDWRHELLVAVHEIVEVAVCRSQGVDPAAVDAFDTAFEAARARGQVDAEAEPGMAPDAPYGAAHRFADALERLLALSLGVDWDTYNAAVTES